MSRAESPAESDVETTVTVRCTGHVRSAVGESTIEFTFEGRTLGQFLDAFFESYDVADLIMATSEETEKAGGWAPPPADLPGTWRQNPEGERVRRYARVLVNGKFNELLEGLDTVLADGDRVSLMYPFVYCV